MANLVTITVKANGDDAKAEINSVAAEARALGGESPTVRIKVAGASEAVAESVAVKGAISDIDRAGKEASSSGGGLSGMGGSLSGLSGVAMPALIGAGVALSPVLATVGTGLGGLGIAAVGTVSPILAAASATGGLKANMDGLSPVQQQMAQQLIGLQGEVGKFTASLQPEVVSVWGSSLKLAGGLLGDIQPVAAAAGSALSGVVADIGADLKTAQWQDFFGFMARTAGPDIQLLGRTFIDFMNTLPQLLQELQPVAEGLLNIADDATKVVVALDTMNPSLSTTSVRAAQVQHDSGNMFTRFLASSKLVISDITGIGKSSDAAASSTSRMAVASQSTVSPVNALSAAMAGASVNTKDLNAAWNTLVGNFNSEQASIVAAEQAVQGYGQAVKTSGAGSLAAQSAFYAAVQSVQQMTDAEVKNHAPATQLYHDIEAQVKALKSKGPLNAAEREDLAGLQKAAYAAATSTAGLTTQQKNAAASIEKDFLPQITALHANGTVLNTDMKNLAVSILDTGTKSAASAAARAGLIQDLESVGVQASVAKQYVSGLAGQIDALHDKTVTIAVNTYDITHTTPYAPPPGAAAPGKASGGIVGAAGGGGRSNFTMVGEQGRELVKLPVGSTVYSNPDTQRMLGQGGGPILITLELGDSFREAGLTDKQLKDIRHTVKRHGGDVQTAFGVH